jgi:cell division protein FtsB
VARARKTSSTSSGGVKGGFKKLLLAAGLLVAIIFAVQGGEYGTRDLMRQKARRAKLVATNDSLKFIVDTLKRYKRRLETDPALQERIAREEFGLVRGNKELLYRFAEGDEGTAR